MKEIADISINQPMINGTIFGMRRVMAISLIMAKWYSSIDRGKAEN
jgi:hypothetical protein